MKRRRHARRSAAAEPQTPPLAGNREFIRSWPPPRAIQAVLDQIQAIHKALEQSGEPVMRYRKVNGILNALAMQLEDGGDHPAVVAHLLDALEAALRAYVSGPAVSNVLLAVEALRKAETQRRP
jgi:hypothetical protein